LPLTSGEAVPLFSITNKGGGTLVGLVQFERELDNLEGKQIDDQIRQEFSPRSTLTRYLQAQGITFEAYRQQVREQVVHAVVHIRPSSSHRILFYSATVPPGYRVEAAVGGTEPIEGGSSTSMSSSTSGERFHCSWHVPASIKQDELKVADRQIKDLAAKGPLTVWPGQPRIVFSLTNSAGEVFEGLLKLFGPGEPGVQTEEKAGVPK
jgi:hypothetical protein